MKKKIILSILCITMATAMFAACKNYNEETNVTPLPVASPNPDISHPEGELYISNGENKAEGGLTVLGEDFLKIMVQGKELEFALSENAKREISIYNKDKNNLRIMRGTMLLITYTERDLIKIAETIDILTAN